MAGIESGAVYFLQRKQGSKTSLFAYTNKENLDQLNLYFLKLFLTLSILTFEQSEKASEEPFFEQSEKARREDNLFLK